MKISILTPDLSHNCLGRAYLLAKVLQGRYEVEIVGPIFGEGIWRPVTDDKSIAYKSVNICGKLKPYWQIKELIQKIDGDIIYAHKPLFTSFGIGLLKKIRNRKPLILDIDDWQMGFIKEGYRNASLSSRLRSLIVSAIYSYSISSYWNNFFGEKLSRFADEVTVSNHFLQRKFGGEVIWHARNTNAFDPNKFDKKLLRGQYGIGDDKKIVMFLGTPRAHKGMGDLIKSIELIKDPYIFLAVAGIDYKDSYCLNLVKNAKKRLGKERFIDFGLQPFEKIPEFLAMADVVAIPQRKTFATIGQVPAKVFDAMAMAKPIVATGVSDIAEILDGCGRVIEPDNPKQLAEATQYILNNPEEAEKIGWKARQKCIKKYSWDAMEKILIKVFEKYE